MGVMPYYHLSSTKGGEALLLDDASVPGKLIHECPSGQPTGDLVYLSVVNLSTAERSLWFAIQGADVPVPGNRDGMDRVDVVPSPTGVTRLVGEPFIVAPGYKFHISSDTIAGAAPLAVYGYVDRNGAAAAALSQGGEGGLIQRVQTPIGDIAAGAWATVPLSAGSVSNPVNFIQDPAANRFAITAGGTWDVSMYGVISVDKQGIDRICYMRLYNETKGEPWSAAESWPVFIENNENGAMWSIPTIPLETDPALVGDYWRVEIGDARKFDDLTTRGLDNVQVLKASFYAWQR